MEIFERIIGGSEADKEETRDDLLELKNKEIKYDCEVSKTPEDIAIIERVTRLVDDVIVGFDGIPNDFLISNIHLLKEGGVKEISNDRVVGGVNSPIEQRIKVDRYESDLKFVYTLAHEMFHAKSPKAAQIFGEKGLGLYRSGIEMVGRLSADSNIGDGVCYFDILEEAIVSECEKVISIKLVEQNFFKKEIEAIESIKKMVINHLDSINASREDIELVNDLCYFENAKEQLQYIVDYSENERLRQIYAFGLINAMVSGKHVEYYSRHEERERMYKLFDSMISASNGELTNREEIFAVFAKSNFSGNYLPMARLVEKYLGKGAFRRIAKDFSKTKIT